MWLNYGEWVHRGNDAMEEDALAADADDTAVPDMTSVEYVKDYVRRKCGF